MTGDARERWRQQYRRQRLRAPKVAAARRVAAPLALVAAVAFAVIAFVVAWGWGVLAFAFFYLGLRLYGVRPFEGGDDSGIGSDVAGVDWPVRRRDSTQKWNKFGAKQCRSSLETGADPTREQDDCPDLQQTPSRVGGGGGGTDPAR